MSEDSDLEETFDKMTLFENVLFDPNEKETTRMVDMVNRVSLPRQLGDWRTIKIDGASQRMVCDCEQCNRTGKCHWVACLEVIQFRDVPPTNWEYASESFGWDDQVTHATETLFRLNISPSMGER